MDWDRLFGAGPSGHSPRIQIHDGSLRTRSLSRLAARILTRLKAEVSFVNPSGLSLVDDGVSATHPKTCELRESGWVDRRHGDFRRVEPGGDGSLRSPPPMLV